MAEATEPVTEQAPAAATPAVSAPEPSGRKILENAKAELKEIASRPSPAEDTTPESAAAPPTPEAPAPEPEAQGTRREQGQKLREQIRKEVAQEFAAKQEADQRQRQSEAQQREFDELIQRADAGDWESKDRVLQILKGNRGMQSAIAEGRNAVLAELGRDITSAIHSLDGLDDDGQGALLKAPSVAEFGKLAFDQGRRIERAIHESTIATLKAENESLKGRLAGNGPSPTPTNGTVVSPRGSDGRFHSMHEAFAASAAELGYRPQR